MSSQTLLYIIIGVAVVGLLIYRNLMARPVRGANQRLYLILGIIGIIQTVDYMQHNHVAAGIGIAALAGSLVLAAVFAVARAATVRVWMQDGQPWSQGSILTGALWIVALGAHLGYDAVIGSHKGIGGLGSATVLLYLVVTLGIQRFIVMNRAAKLDPAGAGQPRQAGWMG
jgi:hypothetical protein